MGNIKLNTASPYAIALVMNVLVPGRHPGSGEVPLHGLVDEVPFQPKLGTGAVLVLVIKLEELEVVLV